MSQKLQFVITVLHEPKLIILDEPFSGFDPINANLIRDEILRLNAEGATIIFSTHRMETVEQMCNNIALINRSKVILEGEVKEIRKAFSTNVFEVIHRSAELKSGEGFRVISTVQYDGDDYLSAIQIIKGSTNDLLAQLLQQTTVIGFSERIPDMNEIFIQAVKKNQPQSV